jgi:hypothetical protein
MNVVKPSQQCRCCEVSRAFMPVKAADASTAKAILSKCVEAPFAPVEKNAIEVLILSKCVEAPFAPVEKNAIEVLVTMAAACAVPYSEQYRLLLPVY